MVLPSVKRKKNQIASRTFKGVQRELGPAESGSLGTTDSSRFPTTPCKSASSNISSPTITAVTSTAGIGINRDTDNVRETGRKGGSTRPKGFCFSDISGAQEGCRPQTGNKPEGSEQIYCGGALQDGGFPHGEGFGDWLAKIDLKDAYFLVPVHPSHQKFLQFQWQDGLYKFQCLPLTYPVPLAPSQN